MFYYIFSIKWNVRNTSRVLLNCRSEWLHWKARLAACQTKAGAKNGVPSLADFSLFWEINKLSKMSPKVALSKWTHKQKRRNLKPPIGFERWPAVTPRGGGNNAVTVWRTCRPSRDLKEDHTSDHACENDQKVQPLIKIHLEWTRRTLLLRFIFPYFTLVSSCACRTVVLPFTAAQETCFSFVVVWNRYFGLLLERKKRLAFGWE